ncbi:hypothetical protein Trco_000610 [Trichoderma cornu-damae]|uniref:Uncharacterized protein n=1 Tax=Trichoderma cornu-damae TaxID=654480 RepID=A0A9P8QVP7_9HYPO|nr:hypothetical protein Trco_000610 [Trichoderma cornu-damae]
MVARGVHGDPSRVVARVGTVYGPDELQPRRRRLPAVDPDLVGGEVGRVEARLGRVEDHAVDARVGLVLVVLHVGPQLAGRGIRGEDGAVAGVPAIHETGSSWAISVRLTSSSVSASSSKAKVKMAPGGVQVPTMR